MMTIVFIARCFVERTTTGRNRISHFGDAQKITNVKISGKTINEIKKKRLMIEKFLTDELGLPTKLSVN